MLHNEKYIGDTLLHKYYTPQFFPLKNIQNKGEVDKYYISNTHEAIMDRNLFNAVQQKLEKKKAEHQLYIKRKHSVFNKRIKCCDCGRLYKIRYKNAETYCVCSSNGLAGQYCSTRNIKESELKKSFVRLIIRLKQFESEIVDFPINQLAVYHIAQAIYHFKITLGSQSGCRRPIFSFVHKMLVECSKKM